MLPIVNMLKLSKQSNIARKCERGDQKCFFIIQILQHCRYILFALASQTDWRDKAYEAKGLEENMWRLDCWTKCVCPIGQGCGVKMTQGTVLIVNLSGVQGQQGNPLQCRNQRCTQSVGPLLLRVPFLSSSLLYPTPPLSQFEQISTVKFVRTLIASQFIFIIYYGTIVSEILQNLVIL